MAEEEEEEKKLTPKNGGQGRNCLKIWGERGNAD